MEINRIIVLIVILGVGYWVNNSREEKKKQRERAIANEQVAKLTQAKRDNLLKIRTEARKAIASRAAEDFKVDYTDDELDWILDGAEARSGKKGLADIGRVFATAPKNTVEKIMMKIEIDHFTYLVDQQAAQRSNELEARWQTTLIDFKKLNPAQQKAHLKYIKKNHAGELTGEQLHVLELITLAEPYKSNR